MKTPQDDGEIRQKLPGTWLVKVEASNAGTKGTMTLSPEGGLLTKLVFTRTNNVQNATYQGYWRVQDGDLLITVTNTDNAEKQFAVGRTNHLKIVSLDNHELVVETKTSGMTYYRRQ